MSSAWVEPEDAPEAPAMQGDQVYLVVCLVSSMVMALALLGRGLGTGAILPALFGILLPLVRWRAGLSMLLLSLLFVVLADHIGTDAFTLVGRLLRAAGRLFFIAQPVGLSDHLPPRLKYPSPLLDGLLAAGVVAWVAAYARLLGVTRNIFPPDRRKRARLEPKGHSGPALLGPVVEQKRAMTLVEGRELPALLLAVTLSVSFGQLLGAWLRHRSSV